MSTWKEIREQVLTLLDVTPDASTDDDIRVAVDRRIVHVRDRLINLRCPDSLLTSSSAVTINKDTEYVQIVGATDTNKPSFELTDFRKIFSLWVEGEEWSYISYSDWIRQKSGIAGDQIYKRSYTVYQGDKITLKTLPTDTEEWEVILHYVAQPATIADDGQPEIRSDHHELIVLDTVLGFPQKFVSEERLALFAAYSKQRDLLEKLFLQDSLVVRRNQRMKPFVRKNDYRNTLWGSGDL